MTIERSDLYSLPGIAGETGVRFETLRYWLNIGLIKPALKLPGRLYFDSKERARILDIIEQRKHGVSLQAIRSMYRGE